MAKFVTFRGEIKMRKAKISLYLDRAQLRLIDEIARKLHQKRTLILREAVNCYISLYLKSKEEK